MVKRAKLPISNVPIDKHLQYRRDRALLTAAAVTSQQLIITYNNSGLAGYERGCLQLLPMLSTACSADGFRRSAKVIRAEKKKKKWAIN